VNPKFTFQEKLINIPSAKMTTYLEKTPQHRKKNYFKNIEFLSKDEAS
jgi:hypothetical protein